MNRAIYFLIVLFSCSKSNSQGIEVIDSGQLTSLQKEGVTVVDIRTLNEYESGHIPDVIHIDFFATDFVEKMRKFDRSEPIIIHCASGGRSGKAANQLQKMGFKAIYDYSGGFKDWKSKGLEVEK